MFGYIVSEEEVPNIKNYDVQSFDMLCHTVLNISIVKNNKILYVNDIEKNATKKGHITVLRWFKNSGYGFSDRIYDYACTYGSIKVLNWIEKNLNVNIWPYAISNASKNGHVHIFEYLKKHRLLKYNYFVIVIASKEKYYQILKWFVDINVKIILLYSNRKTKTIKFLKSIRYKTKNKYLKGYNKN